MKKLIIIISAIVTLGCNSNQNTSPLPTKAPAKKASPKKVKQVSNWFLDSVIDKMDNSKTYFSECVSTNEAYFDFPYDGGSKLFIYIRNMNGRNEVYLRISRGQFVSSFLENKNVKIKFDDGKIFQYGYSDPEDSSNPIIFLDSPNSIIEKLKNSKKVMVKVDFYGYAGVVFDFNVSGLVWKY